MYGLIAAALLAAGDPQDASNESTQAAYQAAKASAGRTPDDQVKLAYWCEAHGLTAQRLRHLAQAVLADPNHAAARGLLGLVARDQRWLRPDAVADQVKADAPLAATLAEYDAKRSSTPYTADGQWQLAQWAEEQGLKDQAKAHLTAVVRIDPKREGAWRQLGYVKHEGRWATEAEGAAARADAEAQKVADKKWKPLLEKWKAQLTRPSQQAEAEANLLTVTDPRAVPSVGKVFGGSEGDGPRAVRLLGQIDTPAASKALAYLAAFGPTTETRRTASETLRGRDPREYANLLISFITKPIHYEVKPVNGPGQPGVLFVEGTKANLKRLYEPVSLIQPNDRIAIDRFGQPVVEHIIDSWAYSKGGRPFNPATLLGIGSLYTDLYSNALNVTGTLADQANQAMWQQTAQYHHETRLGAATVDAAKNVSSPSSLAALIQTNQQAHKGSTRQVVAPLGGVIGAVSPLGFQIDPRDVASETKVQFSLAQVAAESTRSALVSQQQLDQDVARLNQRNSVTNNTNDRITAILNSATGQNIPADPTAWQRWWVNLLGYAFVTGQTATNPTFVEVVPSNYQPQAVPTNVVTRQLYVDGISCFGGGTLVQTLAGPQPIERIQVGDLVLTQSTNTGALGYHPVLVTHHNPPAATFHIKLGDDVIVASAFHRFWVARRGWVMARDIKVDDPIRTLGGVRPVAAVTAGQVELVYNLDVAADADFFAGSSAALVHDNTLPDPRLVPFDRPQHDTQTIVAR